MNPETVIDAHMPASAMVAIAAARMPGARVVAGDAVPLPFPDDGFERVFTGHFYGHLNADERASFLAEARRVGRELVVVDSALRDGVEREEWQERLLTDGSRHRVYKRYFTADGLAAELGGGETLNGGAVVRGRPDMTTGGGARGFRSMLRAPRARHAPGLRLL